MPAGRPVSGVETVEYAVVYTAVRVCESEKAAQVQRDCIAKSQRGKGIPRDARVVRRTVITSDWSDDKRGDR